jgi:acetyltransferase-like isoleucine patch superfamily enzyme
VWHKLVRKVARNRGLGLGAFLGKSLRFVQATAASRFHLRDATSVGVGVRLTGLPPVIQRPAGTLLLGDDVSLVAWVTPIFFDVSPGATLAIGDQAWINDGVWFGCTERITIGQRALIGPGVRLFDNAYHDLNDRRRRPPGRPVTIADDVWIASGVTVLPGVTVGRGAVLGAGAVVQDDVAPFTVVAGNPARVVRTLDPERFVGPASRA